MDRKSIIVLVVSLLLIFAWYGLMNRLFPPQPHVPGTNSIASATNPVVAGTNAVAVTASGPAFRAPGGTLVKSDAPEELVVVENDDARYTFTSYGGGLKLIELKKYPESVGCRLKHGQFTNKLATLNTKAPAPAFALLGGEALQGDGNFTLAKTDSGVLAEKMLPGGLRLQKEFRLGTNYLLAATVRLENRSARPILVPAQELVISTATPMGLADTAVQMAMEWYDGAKVQSVSEPWFANRTLGCFPGTPRSEYSGGNSNVVWAAVHNRFFTMAAIPPTNAPAPQVTARRIPLPPPSAAELADDPKAITNQFGIQTAFYYPETSLAPNQVVERQFNVFAGPKEYKTLDRLAAKFGNNVDLVMGFGGFFGFFAKLLLLSMNGLHSVGIPYGFAIVAITVIIKLVFWPLTQASTRSMKRMQALQPQVKALQEKHKDDPMKMQKKMGELWKEHKVNPAMGCLPMLIQIPFLFGFYRMLQSAIELRGASFLWACDLSQADTIFIIPGLGFIPLLGIPGVGFPVNPLPLIMGTTQLWQMRLTPPSPGVDPVQQKMMQYMPLIFLFVLYNFSSGLTLYWTVQNLLTIAQMKVTKANDPAAGANKNALPSRPAAPSPKKKK
jgi:YidC/Oxa1 family membrane protein insertase